MSFLRTAAQSSRISKPGSRRAAASPLAAKKRRPTSSAHSPRAKAAQRADDGDATFKDRLEDHGVLASLAADLRFTDVAQQILYICSHMYTDIPESGAGMNSVRIAEVLNFRRSLPPAASVAHIHALSTSPTRTEREMARLVNSGVARKVLIPGRGTGAEAVGECIVLVEEWQKLVQLESSLADETKRKYCDALAHSSELPTFSQQEAAALTRAGFLAGATSLHSGTEILLRPGASSTGTLADVSTAGSTYISGTVDAAAHGSVDHISGGSGSSDLLSSISSIATRASQHHVLSLPNMGPYLKLIVDARSHLVSLLARSSKYGEMPRGLLKERWDGGILGTDEASRAAKARGEFKGVMPGRTKKWRQFYGVKFDWVLEECLGAGLVECFKTGSVGTGVRLV